MTTSPSYRSLTNDVSSKFLTIVVYIYNLVSSSNVTLLDAAIYGLSPIQPSFPLSEPLFDSASPAFFYGEPFQECSVISLVFTFSCLSYRSLYLNALLLNQLRRLSCSSVANQTTQGNSSFGILFLIFRSGLLLPSAELDRMFGDNLRTFNVALLKSTECCKFYLLLYWYKCWYCYFLYVSAGIDVGYRVALLRLVDMPFWARCLISLTFVSTLEVRQGRDRTDVSVGCDSLLSNIEPLLSI